MFNFKTAKKALKDLGSFFANKTNSKLAIFVAVLILVVGGYYILLGNQAEESLVEQAFHREQDVLRAGARAIEGFFDDSENSLITLSLCDMVSSFGESTQKRLDDFIAQEKDTSIVEVVLVDKEGIIQFMANEEDTEFRAKTSVADCDCFIMAKGGEEGEVYIGKPTLAETGVFEGQFILPMSTPIFRDGDFKGVIAFRILLSSLTEKYLGPLKLSDDMKLHLLDEEGVFLHSASSELTGKNVSELPQASISQTNEKIRELVKNQSETSKHGEHLFTLYDYYDEALEEKYFLSFSSLEAENRRFFLVGVIPTERTFNFLAPFYLNQTLALITIILLILAFSVFSLRIIRTAQKKAYLKGLKDGQNIRKKNKKQLDD